MEDCLHFILSLFLLLQFFIVFCVTAIVRAFPLSSTLLCFFIVLIFYFALLPNRGCFKDLYWADRGETHYNKIWYPCNDSLIIKSVQLFFLTVKKKVLNLIV